MSQYPDPIKKLINVFSGLPGIGQKTAERLVFYLLGQPKKIIDEFSSTLSHATKNIFYCQKCFNYSDINPCSICRDTKRDKKIICVVIKPQDVIALEKTQDFNGLYHILGGNFNPLEGVHIEQLKIKELILRIKNDSVIEVILALNPDIEGETTSLALLRILKPFPVKITRLARGLPMGSDLEYADEVTLSNAIKGRREL